VKLTTVLTRTLSFRMASHHP